MSQLIHVTVPTCWTKEQMDIIKNQIIEAKDAGGGVIVTPPGVVIERYELD
jgi:hypothetical protein